MHFCLRPYHGETTGSRLISEDTVDFNFTSKYFIKLSVSNSFVHFCLRPYHGETTGSRLISEVKHRRAWVLLGWVTTWEVRVL